MDWVDWQWFLENGKGPGAAVASQLWKMKEKKGLKANDIVHKLLKELDKMNVPLVSDKNLELKDFTNWHWFDPKYYAKKCKKGKCEPETVANVSLDLLGTTVVSESISRSVTPPAPSGTESPIHVKIEE